MSPKQGILYVRLVVSYGEPTEFDDVGCDGMFIESTEMCTKDVANLLRVAKAFKVLMPYLDKLVDVEALIPWRGGKKALEEVRHLL